MHLPYDSSTGQWLQQPKILSLFFHIEPFQESLIYKVNTSGEKGKNVSVLVRRQGYVMGSKAAVQDTF